MADDGHAVFDHHLVGLGQRAVAALGCGQVDDHGARLHFGDGGLVQQGRSLAARNQRGGDDDIGLLGALVHGLGLALHPGGRHWTGVAADTLGAFTFFVGLEGHIDELGAEGFDLFLHRRTHVGGFDHRAQALGRGDGLQAGDAGAEDQHAGGLHGSGGGHQHRHEAWVVVGREHHRLVAGDVGLGGQHVEALGAGRTRRRFEGEGGDAAGVHARDGLVAEGVEHADQHGACAHVVQFAIGRRHDFQHQVGAEGSGVVANGGASRDEGVIRDAGADAGPALHRHLMALAHQLLDGLGCRGNPRLPGVGFERNTDVHFKSPA
ncbi:hypothetical protein D9M68_686410 [compost metagenome]